MLHRNETQFYLSPVGVFARPQAHLVRAYAAAGRGTYHPTEEAVQLKDAKALHFRVIFWQERYEEPTQPPPRASEAQLAAAKGAFLTNPPALFAKNHTVNQLKALLVALGKSTSGNKGELVKRFAAVWQATRANL
jgi:hypothetical protein